MYQATKVEWCDLKSLGHGRVAGGAEACALERVRNVGIHALGVLLQVRVHLRLQGREALEQHGSDILDVGPHCGPRVAHDFDQLIDCSQPHLNCRLRNPLLWKFFDSLNDQSMSAISAGNQYEGG
jgi:hypothetical protein